jgi:hypothetical protein
MKIRAGNDAKHKNLGGISTDSEKSDRDMGRKLWPVCYKNSKPAHVVIERRHERDSDPALNLKN